MDKHKFLSETIKHIDITSFDASPIIDAMRNWGFLREIPPLPLTFFRA